MGKKMERAFSNGLMELIIKDNL